MNTRRRRNDFDNSSILDRIASPFRNLFSWFQKTFADDRIRGASDDSVFMSLLKSPFQWLLAWIVFFVSTWTITRRGWSFVWALPTMGVIAISLMVLWLDNYLRPRNIERTQGYYEKFLIDPLWGPEIAQHFAQKRVDFEPEKIEPKFQLATVWDLAGQSDRARDLMLHLSDQQHVPALVWLARKNMDADAERRTGMSRQELDQQAEMSLEEALELDPESNAARIGLASLYLNQANRMGKQGLQYRELIQKAADRLNQVFITGATEAFWQLPNLVRALVESDQADRAQQIFDQASRTLLNYVRRQPNERLTPAIWETLIRSAVALKDYRLANELIDESRRSASSVDWVRLLNLLAAQTIIAESDDFADRDQISRQLDLLSREIVESPTNQIYADRLIRILVAESTQADKQVGQLEQAMVSVKESGVLHLLIGIQKISDGDAATGISHWRVASSSLKQKTSQLLSVLISVMVRDHRDYYENVLDILTIAIERFPEEGLLYEVRGIYHFGNESYEDAIVDYLNAAEIIGEPRNFMIHFQLARTYEKMGDQAKADEHRRNIQKIKNDVGFAEQQLIESSLARMEQASAEK